jgi:hypothetical protein
MDLLLIGGVSGSGKSVALAALEDSGYYAVSNLPLSQLPPLLATLKAAGQDRVAIVLDDSPAASPMRASKAGRFAFSISTPRPIRWSSAFRKPGAGILFQARIAR